MTHNKYTDPDGPMLDPPTTDSRRHALPSVAVGDSVAFRGCMFDAGWEFDAPCVLYTPCRRYTPNSGNIYGVIHLIEDVCFELAEGNPARIGFCNSDLREFAWRRWSPRGFSRRLQAWHLAATATFFRRDDHLEFSWHLVREWWGKDGEITARPLEGFESLEASK